MLRRKPAGLRAGYTPRITDPFPDNIGSEKLLDVYSDRKSSKYFWTADQDAYQLYLSVEGRRDILME
jgi:hypothetical protein